MESRGTVNSKEPRNLSPCSSGRRSSHSSSPEFEFWMVRNPSFPQPDLISADELFVNGVLLPLHLLPNKLPEDNPQPASKPSVPDPEPEPGPPITSEPVPALSASKRWTDIFKKDKGKNGTKNQEDKDKEKEKKEKKSQSQSRASPAELNINIWPFSRSRSAGTNGTRPRMTTVTRKVSSAPCSRSNSAGESKSRKWPSSPGRPGVHLGRSSPVWQVRRGGSVAKSFDVMARSTEKSYGKKEVTETRRGKIGHSGNSSKAKVLNLNVPICIGYRHPHHLSCRTDENNAFLADVRTDSNGNRNADGGSGANGRSSGHTVGSGSNFFNFRNLFVKKVY